MTDKGNQGLPSSFVEVGLAEGDGERPPDHQLEVTKTVREDRNPIWNTQLLLEFKADTEPVEKDFIYIGLIENSDTAEKEKYDQIWIPIHAMLPFLPYNLVLESKSYEFKIRGRMFISVILEKIDLKSNPNDEYVNIVVNSAYFDPFPNGNIKRFWVAMTLYNFTPKEIEWINIDLEDLPDLERLFKNYSEDNKSKRVFLSSILKVPPNEIELFYNGICCFCIPKSYLEYKIQFFVYFRDLLTLGIDKLMPNTLSGYTQIMDKQLTDMF